MIHFVMVVVQSLFIRPHRSRTYRSNDVLNPARGNSRKSGGLYMRWCIRPVFVAIAAKTFELDHFVGHPRLFERLHYLLDVVVDWLIGKHSSV